MLFPYFIFSSYIFRIYVFKLFIATCYNLTLMQILDIWQDNIFNFVYAYLLLNKFLCYSTQ